MPVSTECVAALLSFRYPSKKNKMQVILMLCLTIMFSTNRMLWINKQKTIDRQIVCWKLLFENPQDYR